MARLLSMRGYARAKQLLERFARGRGGSAAVEFAMVALPFLALIMGILEISMIYLVSTLLDNATSDAAREIRTGQMQMAGGGSSTTFAANICSKMSWIGAANCSSNLYVDVRTFASFNTMTQSDPITTGTFDPTLLTFSPGTAGQIVLVRAFYKWQLFAPGLDRIAATMNNGSTLITATVAFQNEPYSTNGT